MGNGVGRSVVVLVIVAVMLSSSAMALSLSSSGQVTSFRTTPRSCYFDVELGTVCPGYMPAKAQTFHEDQDEECYFDRVRGAVCPAQINPINPGASTATFRPRVYKSFEDRVGPPQLSRISSPPPFKITGDFRPRFDLKDSNKIRIQDY